MLRLMNLQRAALAGALLLSAALAHAQYSWIDEKGTRHFSDRPPPPSTPAAKILKQPRTPVPAPAPAATAKREWQPAFSIATESGSIDIPPGPDEAERKQLSKLAQQEAAYRERVKQRAEQEKKEAEDAQRQNGISERCRDAAEVLRQNTSGIRVAKVDVNGERSYMTDEEKAAQNERVRKMLAECRG
ncbi:DUF4124 domain-containing protein [Massilia yuzhufengensis]|uniref:DUF4124 domain-containing protein n=1 Tax=Massilia yuzhufengensis TaxID=1164594 RepID=A0A1I1J3C6_9BURK|nr:DUF4124 domain-containing protein [Massilia yuzhufengensis]SFC42895.1 protein of unknown function [Massilia yuzhufengensis]